MVAPDVEVEGKGVILISSEEGETEANNDKFLKDFGLKDGSILTCDDFLQNYQLKMILFHADKMDDGQEFIVTGDKSQLQPKEEEPAKEAEPVKETGNKDSAIHVAENDDVEVVSNGDRKRPADDTNGVHKAKKQKVDDDDDDVVICEVEENGKAATPAKKASPPPAEDGVICIE